MSFHLSNLRSSVLCATSRGVLVADLYMHTPRRPADDGREVHSPRRCLGPPVISTNERCILCSRCCASATRSPRRASSASPPGDHSGSRFARAGSRHTPATWWNIARGSRSPPRFRFQCGVVPVPLEIDLHGCAAASTSGPVNRLRPHHAEAAWWPSSAALQPRLNAWGSARGPLPFASSTGRGRLTARPPRPRRLGAVAGTTLQSASPSVRDPPEPSPFSRHRDGQRGLMALRRLWRRAASAMWRSTCRTGAGRGDDSFSPDALPTPRRRSDRLGGAAGLSCRARRRLRCLGVHHDLGGRLASASPPRPRACRP